VLDYTVRAASGEFRGIDGPAAKQQFDQFLATPLQMLIWHTLFIVMTLSVVARGVNAGLEKANMILMPALFAILLILVGYSMAVGDFSRSAQFMFTPDFSKVTPVVVVSALGHAFFSLSLGMGAIMVYGSYLQRHVSIARTTIYIAVADTGVGILIGLAIFALVFANNLEAGAGPGLMFQTLPIAFGSMPGGDIVGTLFFLLVTFAAWTSAISLVEPAIAWLTENTRLTRKQSAWLIGITDWLLGIAVLLSFNEWQHVRIVFDLGIFDTLDKLTSTIMLPLGGLAMALFAGYVMKTGHVREELSLGMIHYRIWRALIRYVAPLAILAVFLYLLGLIGS
jgi:NSS family neurotransmitter:Na+ symporter